MFLLVFGMAFASEVPLPEADRRPWVGGQVELSAGVGGWQVPSVSFGDPWSAPRANVHATLLAHLTGAAVAGMHLAGWSLPDERRGFRLEPRVGVRLVSWKPARLDASLGVAVDKEFGPRTATFGPVLASTLRVWPKPGAPVFLAIEGRLAPLASSNHAMCMPSFVVPPAECMGYRAENPGGSGVLLGVGYASR